MDKYNKLLQVKPPHLQSQYLTEIINRSDIVFTHKTLELEFIKEKKVLTEKISPKKGGNTITLVF